MESTVKERLVSFLKYKKISQSKFEGRINAGNGFVNNISKGIGAEKLQRIICEFPELNTGWLIDGIGDMLKKNEHTSPANSDIISMPSDVWAVISSQAESLKSKDRQIDIALAQTSEMLELLKEQLKKGRDAPTRLRAANLVVEEDE